MKNNKNDIPSFVTGLPDKPNDMYLKDFKKTVFARNARNFALIFSGCFIMIILAVVVIPSIPSTGKDSLYVAQSQDIVKFAKVETNNYSYSEDAGILAGSAGNQETSSKPNDRYTSINLSKTRKQKTGFKAFKTKTNCVANIRSKPNKDSTIIVQKEYREEVKVIGEENDWWKISYNNDGYAYIHKTCVRKD